MSEAHIQFATYSFHEKGATLYSLGQRYENNAEGKATAIDQTYTVRIRFADETFASIEQEIMALRTVLAQNPEGLLLIKDETGAVLHQRHARVVSDTVPESWRQYTGDVTVTFTSRDNSPASSAADASFTPTGSTAITLPNIVRWNESIRTTAYHPDKAVRQESRETIRCGGVIHADTTLDEAARRTWLLAEKDKIQAAADIAPEGVLAFGGQERTVQVDNLTANLAGDGSHRLEWDGEFHRKRFPSGSYAEAQFDVTPATDHRTGEVQLTVSGTIRASDEAEATNKFDSIRSHYLTDRALLNESFTDNRVHGADTAEELPGEWCEKRFSLTFRDTNLAVENYNLRIGIRQDKRTGIDVTTYSGTVVAATDAAALTKARELGMNKLPFATSSSEDRSYARQGTGDSERFVQVDFSYEYQARNACQSAEVTTNVTKDRFGSWTITVSGNAVATDLATAQAVGRSFALGSTYLQVGENEDDSHVQIDGTSQFQQFRFNYRYVVPNDTTSLEYSVSVARNFEQGEARVTYQGIARGVSKEICAAFVAATIGTPIGGRLASESTTENYRKIGTKEVFDGFRFAYTWSGPVDLNGGGGGGPGTSIVEAEYTLSRTYSAPNNILTPIPYSTAHVQENVGTHPGALRITGSATGYSYTTLRDWARGKKTHATGDALEDPPTENVTYVSPKQEPNSTRIVRFSFNYPYRYAELND